MSAIADIDREALIINLLEESSDDESIARNVKNIVERSSSSSDESNGDNTTSSGALVTSELVAQQSDNAPKVTEPSSEVIEIGHATEVIDVDSPNVNTTRNVENPIMHYDKRTIDNMLMQGLFSKNSRHLNKAVQSLNKNTRRLNRLWPEASPFIKKVLSLIPPSVITNPEDGSIQFSGKVCSPGEAKSYSSSSDSDPIPETFNSSIIMMKKMFPHMEAEFILHLQQESSALIRDRVNNMVHCLEVVDIRKVESDKTEELLSLYEYTLESLNSDIPACGFGSIFAVHCKTWEHSSTCLSVVYSNHTFDSFGNMPDYSSHLRIYICTKTGNCENTGLLPAKCLPKIYRDKSVERQVFYLINIGSIITTLREYEGIKALKYVKYHVQSSIFCSKADSSITKRYKECSTTKKPTKPKSVPSNVWEYLESSLNIDQLSFIDKAMRNYRGFNNVLLLQGPPGTGKSSTIVGLVTALVNGTCPSPGKKATGTKICAGASIPGAAQLTPDCRILVCAPSNTAVDELAWRLHKQALGPNGRRGHLNIVRFGWLDEDQTRAEHSEEKSRFLCHINLDFISESVVDCSESAISPSKSPRKSFRRSSSKLRQSQLAKCHVVCTTLNSAGSRSFIKSIADISKDSTFEFDAVIIDEACQASEPSSLIPLKFNPKLLVLIGDPQQLPVVLFSRSAHKGNLGRSLFERFQLCGWPVDCLTTQYRMHQDIVNFPSQKFYEGTLVTSRSVLDREKPVWHSQNCFPPVYFWNISDGVMNKDSSNSYFNRKEKDFIVGKILLNLSHLLGRKSTIEIGVITFYSSQVRSIKDAINRLHVSNDFKQSIKVSTVDGFQGSEKDIIILSCVRGPTDGSSGVGFLGDYRRVNVSLTRARKSLWIVGNAYVLKVNKFWRAFLTYLDERNFVGDYTNFQCEQSNNKRSRDDDTQNNGNGKRRRGNYRNWRGGRGGRGGRGPRGGGRF